MTTTETPTETVTTLEARHLARMELSTAAPLLGPNAPGGTQVVIPVTGGRVEGARFRGTVVAPSADWTTMRADGTTRLDIRMQIETDDGALVLVRALGTARPGPHGIEVRSSHQYETGDERYAWLNGVQAITIGTMTPTGVDLEVYELLAAPS